MKFGGVAARNGDSTFNLYRSKQHACCIIFFPRADRISTMSTRSKRSTTSGHDVGTPAKVAKLIIGDLSNEAKKGKGESSL